MAVPDGNPFRKSIKEAVKMSKPKRRLYIAYGSNLNLEQMSQRCPTAQVVGTSWLKNWRLLFRGGNTNSVATVERFRGGSVPILVWQLQPQDEIALDHYEGCPSLYRKEILRIRLNRKTVDAMIYIMNEVRPYGLPNHYYFNTIREGYISAGFNIDILRKAALDSQALADRNHLGDKCHVMRGGNNMEPMVKEQILAVRDTGETNMFDVNTVMQIANRKGFHELVVFLNEHRSEYARFILTGETD